MKKALVLLIIMFLLVPVIVYGQTVPSSPAIVSYQGRIAEGGFDLLPDGYYEMTFLIFDAQTGGNLLWSETQPAVELASSMYHVGLGSVQPLEFSTFKAKDAWLEVRIFGETFSGRRRIVSVPFALKAEGEVPAGAIILGQTSADPAFTPFGYTQQGSTVGPYYLYQKNAYNPAANRVPQVISYQARIKPIGTALGPSADLGFSIYTAAEGGSAVWSEFQPGAAIPGGMIDADLGSFTPILPTYLTSKDLWLEVSVNSQTLSPREKLEAAPYALKVESPVPPGGIVLSSTAANPDLVSKKFTAIGTALSGYYPFRKDVFSASSPSVPLLIGYQGRINQSPTGLPLTGPADIGFYIYSSALAGTVLWSETVTGVTLDSGIFNVLLGAGSTITPDTFTGPQAYLEIHLKVGTTTEVLSPRERITSVPFAMQAEGTLPNTAIIIATSSNSPELINAGYKMSGSLNSLFVYSKYDIDTTPPSITIAEPSMYSGFNTSQVHFAINFSDDLSGINTSTFHAEVNGQDISSSFTVGEASATADITLPSGENVVLVAIADNTGNSTQTTNINFVDTASTLPTISFISPGDGSAINNNTPMIQVQFGNITSGIDQSSISIKINGIEKSGYFTFTTEGSTVTALWQVPYSSALPDGINEITGTATTNAGVNGLNSSYFTVTNTGTTPEITAIEPKYGSAGDTVTITGVNFSNTVSLNKVFLNGKEASIQSCSSSQLIVHVPAEATSGLVEVTVRGKSSQNPIYFIIGLNYGFVANYNNFSTNPSGPSITTISLSNPIGHSIRKIVPSSSRPYDVALSPDAKFAYVTDEVGRRLFILDTSLADAGTADPIIDTITFPDSPRYVKASPDGLYVCVGLYSGTLYILKNHTKIFDFQHMPWLGNYKLNGMDVSISNQRLFIAQADINLESTNAGQTSIVNLDQSTKSFLTVTNVSGTNYRNPKSVAVKPNQSEVYVANNNANGTSDGVSYSVLDVTATSFKRTQGATIDPFNDTHDVSHPYDLLFDPRGRLFYSTFSGTGNPASSTNNIGVQKWVANGSFHAGTYQRTVAPFENPRGLGITPDAKYIFSANFGSGTGANSGNRLMIFNNSLVKQAIDQDASDSRYSLNTVTPVRALDSSTVVSIFPGMISYASTVDIDGPVKVAFQNFPIIDLYPNYMFLAEGGVKNGNEILRGRVHPIWGETVRVGLNDGSSIVIDSSDSLSWFSNWLGVNRDIFQFSDQQSFLTKVSAQKPGIGKVYASCYGYPSNIVFVTVPPQQVIQMMVGEQQVSSTNPLTQLCLISIVRNRLRLPPTVDHDGNPNTGKVSYGFNVNRITAETANEKLVVDEIRKQIDCNTFNTACSWAGDSHISYVNSATRPQLDSDNRLYHDERLVAYDLGVIYAGWTMMDLLRTGSNNDHYKDPTDGCFSYWSPTVAEWDDNPGDGVLSINEVLLHHNTDGSTTDFPNSGNLILGRVCRTEDHKGMVYNFCDNSQSDSNASMRGKYLQIVFIAGSATYASGRPHFVFLRLRSVNEPSVVTVYP